MRKGAAWELHLEQWHSMYATSGIAYVVKCHPGVKMVNGHLIYSSVGPPDYMGLFSTGRSIAFEAKEVQGTTFPFKNLEPHQAHALDMVYRLGGAAFLAVRSMDGIRQTGSWLLPWSRIQEPYLTWSRSKGRASVKLPEAGLPMGPMGWYPVAVDLPPPS